MKKGANENRIKASLDYSTEEPLGNTDCTVLMSQGPLIKQLPCFKQCLL